MMSDPNSKKKILNFLSTTHLTSKTKPERFSAAMAANSTLVEAPRGGGVLAP